MVCYTLHSTPSVNDNTPFHIPYTASTKREVRVSDILFFPNRDSLFTIYCRYARFYSY